MRNAQFLFIFLFVCSVAAADRNPNAIVAKVGNQTITARVVDREIARLTPKPPEDVAALEALQKSALKACIERSLALQQLIAQKQAASDADVDLAISRLKKELAAREAKWDDYVKKSGLSESELRREIQWGLSWERYLQANLSGGNLQRYFDQHKPEFDGTTKRVAHILLKVTPQSRDQVLKEAEALRAEIAAGKLTFADAAAKHSIAPTGKSGGDIGFIERRRPMPESFSAAAFALEDGEVSAPVETSFGIHLIQCLETKPGELSWEESRDELRAAVTRFLFDRLAKKRRKEVTIE